MNEELATLIQSNVEFLKTIHIDEKKVDKIHSFYYSDATTEGAFPIKK